MIQSMISGRSFQTTLLSALLSVLVAGCTQLQPRTRAVGSGLNEIYVNGAAWEPNESFEQKFVEAAAAMCPSYTVVSKNLVPWNGALPKHIQGTIACSTAAIRCSGPRGPFTPLTPECPPGSTVIDSRTNTPVATFGTQTRPNTTSPPIDPIQPRGVALDIPAQPASLKLAASSSVVPFQFSFKRTAPRPDDVAVIIGNADYASNGKDIPSIPTAAKDAAAVRRYVVEALGVREENVIWLPNATGSKFAEVFGHEREHRGRLFNYVKAGRSRVFVYFSGHGAPAGDDRQAMLVPSDASASHLALTGYPLSLLYANLGKIPATSITVVLDACFSGTSPSGSLVPSASPLNIAPKFPAIPSKMTVISAGTAEQMASWEEDGSYGLLTKYYLLGMSGEADAAPFGNGDGKVSDEELEAYLKEKVTYLARRYYGRDQTVQVQKGREN